MASSTASYQLASLQAAMLVNHLRAPRSGVDVVQMVSALHERVEPNAMRDAWARISARHDALRTTLVWEHVPEPQQQVQESAPPIVSELDWSDTSGAEDIAARMRAFLAADRTAGFDLRAAPLQRVALVRLANDEWRMVWTFHHILMDGRSFAIVLREVFATYDATLAASPAVLPQRRPYRDFVSWYNAQDFTRHQSFWRERLRGLPGATPLPLGFFDTNAARHGRGLQHRMLDAETTAAVERLARANTLTLNNVVQGAWALLLAHHSGEDDVVFGATRACRKGTIEGADDMVGLFINTLPVRVQVRPESTVAAWLKELRDEWRSLFEVEHTPLQYVQRWSEVGSNTPLFGSQVVFENLPLQETLQLDGGAMTTREFHLYGGTNFPLTALIYGGKQISLELEHERHTVDDATAQRLLEHLATLLEGIAAYPDGLVGDLTALSPVERSLVVEQWNDTRAPYSEHDTLVSLMAAQVARTPDATAVIDEVRSLSFAELDARANALAHRLRERGVGRDVLVGVCAERSVDLVVALVAVLKAGGAYVPLDPDHPADRLAFMLEDAAVPVVLAQRRVAHLLPALMSVIWLDDVVDAESASAAINPLPPVAPDDLAYMIFTSGSTGRPKGALNAHRGIVNRLQWMQHEYQLVPRDVVLQKTPFSFDVSVWEFFWPLFTGARLVLARPGGHRETAYLAETISANGVTVCHFVPSMLRAFLADPDAAGSTSLRDVMASGEALAPDLVASFQRTLPSARLHNLYGPTECAVDVSYWPCPPAPAVVPIGRPIANTRLYVLDSRGRPTPIGVPGELHIGGVQVGRGYHRRPALTAQKFISDPFAHGSEHGARLYRTGDRARWRSDGTIEFLGRLDFQVKVRGFRIELGEIESALLTHGGVRDAVVVTRDEQGDRRLVAYMVADGELPSIAALRVHLLATLPEYMVPALFVWLPTLPLSSNGKVDRRALPVPEVERQALSRAFVEPSNPAERTLAEIWSSVLRLDRVGTDDNFFELGGDSLLGVQILSRAAERGLRVTLTELLHRPTIAQLARVARVAHAARAEAETEGPVRLTPVQHWFFETQSDELHYWNQALMFIMPLGVDVALLAAAVDAVTRHHDSLRLRFERIGDAWRQRLVAEAPNAEIDVAEVGSPTDVLHAAALNDVCARVQGSLDLAAGPMLRAGLIRFGAGEHPRLLIAAHHLTIDGVSWRVLREDLETAYLQRQRGEAIVLPPRTTPFSAWAARLADPTLLDALRGDLPYWERVGSPASLRVPRDMPADDVGFASDTETVTVRLDETETRALFQSVPAAYNTQINEVLLAALGECLGAWLGAGDVVVNLEGHGREDVVESADVSRTMGWFTTIFPVRLRLGASDIGTRLKETKELLRGAPRRGVSYGLLRYLDGAETLRAQTTPDVVFNYLGQFDQVVADSTLMGFASESTGSWYGSRTRRPHLVEINALVVHGRLEARWSYSRRAHRVETMHQVADAYAAALRGIISHCSAPGVRGYTPSDFPLAALDQATLDRIVGDASDIEDIYPLTPLQELFVGYADPATDPGFEQWRYMLRGHVDVDALRAAWEFVATRHAIMRTSFVSEGLPRSLQVVRIRAELPWAEHDLRDLAPAERTRRANELLALDREHGFAFDRAPLMRIALMRLADEEFELVWTNHHLLFDRWSWPLVLLEISRAYPAFAAGETPVLQPAARYADFIAWQQEQSHDEARAFWSGHFASFEAPPRLAMVNAAAAGAGAEARVELTTDETKAIHAFSRAKQVATSTLLEAAWALWLARRGAHHDVSFGVAVGGRDAGVAGIDRMVGLTINNLPLRVRVPASAQVGVWLSELHASQAEMQQYAYVPLAHIQEWSGVPWRTRLFDTLLVFQHDDAEEVTQSWLGTRVETSLIHVPTRTAYPLSMMIAGGTAISLRATFDTRYLDSAAALEMTNGFRAAILTLISAGDESLSALLARLPVPSRILGISTRASAAYVAPRTATETVLAGIWGDMLGVERVGAEDDFFMMGGYSLVAAQIVSRVRSTLQLDVPVRLIFQHPTVAQFAVAIIARERKPGQLERVAQIVQRVKNMSPDELRSASLARAATT